VALQSQPRVVGGHPAPVVADQDPLDPAAVELDLQAGRARVERVLDQLLDD